MTTHAMKTEIRFTDESKIMAGFLAQMVAFWYEKFSAAELRESMPLTRAAWLESLGRLMVRSDIGDLKDSARKVHDVLATAADFEIRHIADDGIVIEYSAPLLLTMTMAMTNEPPSERDQSTMH